MSASIADVLQSLGLSGAVEFGIAASKTTARLALRDEIAGPLREAVAPFRVKIDDLPDGVRLHGDGPAVLIARRTLERLAAQDGCEVHVGLSIRELIEDVVDNVLKRELACHLPGVRQAITPLSLSQVAFLKDLLDPNCPLVFGVGPSATGKTHIAIAAGMSLLANGNVRHVVVTKPHEMLDGEVVTPQIRAETACDEQFERLRDVLDDLVGYDKVRALEAQRRLEIIPLGAMRGRVFNHSFIIVDEAHHANVRRMRLAVTRAGIKSRTVVIGDPSKIQLRSGEDSGLAHLLAMIHDARIGRVHPFQARQVIRSETVKRLEALYDKEDPARFVDVTLPSEDGRNVRY